MSPDRAPLSAIGKVELATRVWFWYAVVRVMLRRKRLPDLVRWLAHPSRRARPGMDPRRLGRVVDRALRCGPFRARCLSSSLVLFRLLREQGAEPELILGLPSLPNSHEAHAWIEVGGVVVGPPPGRLGHYALTRYGNGLGADQAGEVDLRQREGVERSS